VSSDVTIHISVGSGGSVSSQGATAQSTAATEPPPPLALEQLQVSGGQSAPVPLSPEELSATTATVSAGSAPRPMAIEQLQAATVASAPEPRPLGALEEGSDSGPFGGAPPRPLSPGEIGAEAAPPGPLSPEELGSPESLGTPPASAKNSRK
jgi:hypothetical protein